MSAGEALAAFEEWRGDDRNIHAGFREPFIDGYLVGYRRALEDAAEACKKWRHDPDAAELIERDLRARAAAADPRDGTPR